MYAKQVRKLVFPQLFVLAICSALLCGCAVQRYQSAPIDPAKNAASLEARSLSSTGLQKYFADKIQSSVSSWPPKRWNLADLTLAAFYYNPDLDGARARVAEAEAGIVTAKSRPNPSISASLGGETAPESPWLAGIGFSLPIETAGKRRYRTSEAEKLADVARWDLAAAAWKVRSEVRSAMVEYLAARRSLALVQSADHLRVEQATLFQQRLAAGMIPQPEVNLARIQETQARLSVRTAEGRVSQAAATLAEAIGVPVSAIDSVLIEWPAFDEPPAVTTLSAPAIQDDAVLNRLDVRRALEAYSAAEAELQLEISKQYPDFNLGTSYAYEEGAHLFSIPFELTLPVFDRNQGPIAEAKAHRQEMAADFLAVQAAGVAHGEEALAKYSSALDELAQARQLLQQSRAQVQETQKALGAGESDRVALNGAQLQEATSSEAELDALGTAQQALGELEDAVQRPLVPGDIQPLTSASAVLNPREGDRR